MLKCRLAANFRDISDTYGVYVERISGNYKIIVIIELCDY